MIKVNHYQKASPEYIHEKKETVAKKMKPIGEDMHHTFKKLSKAVSKLGSTHKKYGDEPF